MEFEATARFSPKLSELPKMLHWAREAFMKLSLGLIVSRKMELALEEVLVNILRYALLSEKEPIEIQIRGTKGVHVEVSVLDRGPPFNPLEAPLPELETPLEEKEEGGLGIFLLRQIVDSLDYDRREGMNILILKKKAPPDRF